MPYRSFAASTLGSRHEQLGDPLEDASGRLERPDLVAVAVADGVSDVRCPHSADGARLAVATVLTLLEQTSVGALDSWRFRRDLVEGWHRAVRERANELGDEFHAQKFATTLLFAARTNGRFILGKIGDGDLFATVGVPARVVRPYPPDHCAGPITIDHPEAADAMGIVELNDDAEVRIVFVATDGYASPFSSDNWQVEVAGDLLKIVESGRTSSIESSLPSWIAESARFGGDDASVGLIVREPCPS